MLARQKGLIVLASVISLLLMNPCKIESASVPKAAATPAKPQKAGERLVFFALQPGTSIYATNVGLSQLVNKYTPLMTTVQPYASSKTRFENLRKGTVDLATATSANSFAYTWGIPSATEPDVKDATPEARLLLGGNNLYYGWITRRDTGIKTIPDLKGRKVTGQIPGQMSLSLLFEETLHAYGLRKEDIQYVPYANTPATLDALNDYKVDATFSSLGGAKIEEVSTTRGVHILPFPPDKRHLLSERPELMKIHMLPAKHLVFFAESTSVIGFQNFLVCLAKLSEESAYLITKTIIEHSQELISVSQEFKEWDKKRAVPPDFFIPYHPGAIKYFRDQGMWNPQLEARQKEMLEKIAKLPKTK